MNDDSSGDGSECANVEEERADESVAEGRGAKLSIGQVKDETEDEKEAKQNRRFKEEKSEHEETNCVFRSDHLGHVLFEAEEEGITEVGSAGEPKNVPKVTDEAEEARRVFYVVFPEEHASGSDEEE